MKKISQLVLISILFVCFTKTADAKFKIPFGSYEKINKVSDLPDTEDYALETTGFMDLGVKYTVFQVLYIPIYQQGETEIVGYGGTDDSYIELTPEDISAIAKANTIDVEKLKSTPFWDAWGGKIVLLVIAIGLVYFFFIRKSGDEEDEEETGEIIDDNTIESKTV